MTGARPRRCVVKGCEERENLWTPEFRFWATGYKPGDHPPLVAQLADLIVCPAHQGKCESDWAPSLVAEINKVNGTLGKLPVDPKTMQVEWSRS
jgi:hypothetical protein